MFVQRKTTTIIVTTVEELRVDGLRDIVGTKSYVGGRTVSKNTCNSQTPKQQTKMFLF